jgi:mono/diheme cytochrome c family protein
VLVACVAVFAATAGIAAAQEPAEQGKALYEKNCVSCHTLGGGDTAGPDLEGIAERRDPEHIRRFIADPSAVIAEGDPDVKAMVEKFGGLEMPDLGLSDADVDAIVAYLETQAGAPSGGATTTETGATTTTTQPAAKGDAATGEELFTGEKAFTNDGASCVSCHSLAGTGALGGGQLGPDLTEAYERFGGATGLASVLETIAFPTMVPIYDDHPLTKQEAADLAAFIQTAAAEEPAGDRTWLYVVLGVALAIGLLLLALLIWPRRRLVVRRSLVAPPTERREA